MASHSEEPNMLRGTGAWTQFVHASSKNTTHSADIPQAIDIAAIEDDDPVSTNTVSGVTGTPKAWEPVFDIGFWHELDKPISVDDRYIGRLLTQIGVSRHGANQTLLSSELDTQSTVSVTGESTSRSPGQRNAK